METALEIPWIASSWAVNRIATCDAPVFWMKAEVSSDSFPLYLGAGIPRLERFKNTGVAALLIGPGLDALPTDAAVPADVSSAYTLSAGQGAVLVTPPAPAEQTDCNYLAESALKASPDTHSVLGRCNFCEPPSLGSCGRHLGLFDSLMCVLHVRTDEQYGQSDSWPQADSTVVVGPGTYYVAFWAFEGTSASISTGKFWATMSDDTMVENFGPIRARSCGATPITECEAADISDVDRAAAQTSCEDAGACTFTEASTSYDGSQIAASCSTTPIQACTDADLSVNPETACEAAGECTYTAGPATTWGPWGMGPPGEFPVPSNQGHTFYEQGAHAGMANMAPPAVSCSTCAFGTGHSGTPSTSCPAGCDTSSGCSAISCSGDDEAACEASGTAADVNGASCTFTAANPTPAYGPAVEASCDPTPDDCNEFRTYLGDEITCNDIDGTVRCLEWLMCLQFDCCSFLFLTAPSSEMSAGRWWNVRTLVRP
eukprot:COSAG02_NODE_106_length_36326_cov_13.777266_20_plen_486_part_00